jgi:tetratricopeptide (TPR) repeat protein
MTAVRTPLLLLACAGLVACGGAADRQTERKAIQRETSADELYKRGRAAQSIGDLTRAEQYYVAALRAGGSESQIIKPLLLVCVTDQRYPVALEYAEQYLHRHPNDVDVEFATASIHAALGNGLRARRLLERVLHRRPNWSDAHYTLATVLREDGAPAAIALAEAHDLEYLRLDPRGPLAERARARLNKAQP